jgi:3-isopropylmalate/(R)-2-methylmalate dehydratase small subunit
MAKVVFKVGDDVSTDTIYPGRFMATVLPTETPQFAFADYKEVNARIKGKELPVGSIIVGGKNFGCGSSREQAASCLATPGLVVVARNLARIFLQNSINVGLQTVICPTIEADEGDEIEVVGSVIKNLTKEKEFPIVPLPKARQAIIDAGGLIPYTKKLITSGKK